MSVQVSLKKQFIFCTILLFLIIIIPEQISKIVIPEMETKSCIDVIIKSEVYTDLSKDKITSLCKDYQSLKTLNTNDGSFAMIFPNQNFEHIKINSIGIRGDDISPKENQLRIIMIGGSTTFGSRSISDQTTIPLQLSKLFQSKFDDHVEVINAGIGGASSFNEIEFLEQKLLTLNPDVIIVYDGWNDLVNPVVENSIKNVWEINAQIFLKDVESYFYLPRAIEKISHKISSMIYLEIYGIQNLRYAQDSEEVFAKKAKLWSERWSFECDKLSLENVDVHIFLQPILGAGNKSYSEYESYLINDKSLQRVSQHYDLLRKELPKLSEKCNSINDISDVFDNVNVPIYFDLGHTSDLGNKIIAEKIFDKIYHDIEIQILNKNK